jgi:hypothetical protein
MSICPTRYLKTAKKLKALLSFLSKSKDLCQPAQLKLTTFPSQTTTSFLLCLNTLHPFFNKLRHKLRPNSELGLWGQKVASKMRNLENEKEVQKTIFLQKIKFKRKESILQL